MILKEKIFLKWMQKILKSNYWDVDLIVRCFENERHIGQFSYQTIPLPDQIWTWIWLLCEITKNILK